MASGSGSESPGSCGHPRALLGVGISSEAAGKRPLPLPMRASPRDGLPMTCTQMLGILSSAGSESAFELRVDSAVLKLPGAANAAGAGTAA